MLMFRSKRTANPEVDIDYKDWRTAWPEVEALAQRLDVAREHLSMAKEGSWAAGYWGNVVDVLTRKWKLTVNLYQSGLRQKGGRKEAYKIDFDWFEGHDGLSGPMFPWMNVFNNWFNQPSLERAWALAQEEKLQKARQGLA